MDKVAQATNAMLLNTENAMAKRYRDLEAEIDKARRNGDTFELGELKDKREQAQKNYWAARKRREGILEQVQEQSQKRQEELFQQQIEHFHKEIPDPIPDFNEDVAMKIRDFAVPNLHRHIFIEVWDEIRYLLVKVFNLLLKQFFLSLLTLFLNLF